MRLIADGVVDRDGVEGLAARLGYEQRQVRRLVTAELGAGPLAIARAQRAQTARILIETTTLPLSEIAFAAGFASIRQFNATIREVFAVTPTELRERAARRGHDRARSPRRSRRGPIPPDPPGDGPSRAGPDQAAAGRTGRRSTRSGCSASWPRGPSPGWNRCRTAGTGGRIQLPNGTGILSLGPLVPAPGAAPPGPGYVDCELQLEDLRDLTAAVQRCRRLLDLDADPEAVTGYLSADPVLGPLALAASGTAVARARGRQRAGAAGRARPAGVGGRGPAARGAAGGRLRQAARHALTAR